MPLVSVIMGSSSDEPVVQETSKVLEELGVDYEVRAMSAHRNPDRVREYVLEAPSRGVEVFIAAAGGAAALPGVISSWTTRPVIGVPLASSELNGPGRPHGRGPDASRGARSMRGRGRLGGPQRRLPGSGYSGTEV